MKRTRRLQYETLESRHLLSADVWQQPITSDVPVETVEVACVPGTRLSRACDLGVIEQAADDLTGRVHRRARSAIYRFELDERQLVQLRLAGMSGNADLYLLNASGKTVASSRSRGSAPETIEKLLQPGTYHVRVYTPSFRTATAFDLSIELTPWAPVDVDIRQAIVAIAMNELGRGPRQVGTDMAEWPGALSRSLVGRNPPWCSEFVSWTYAAGGVPFVNGSHGGWMLDAWPKIIRHFNDAGLYVKKGSADWKALEPQPGDYVHMKGHSAMVLEVDGDRLITLEGNIGNRVVSREFANWRSSRILGIGSLT